GFEFDGFLTDQRILSAVIAALESECARALRAGLEILAREKERAVPCLLDPTGADLHPEIVRALRGIEQRHSLWLSARDFPQSEARHLVMKLKREPKGSPNAGLLDAGLTLFFFGQNQ